MPPSLPMLLLLLTACGASSDPGPDGDSGVASVSVTPADTSVLAGSTIQLSAAALDAAGAPVAGQTITWSSSDAGVATVSGSGLVTTLTPGTAQIVATAGGKSDGVQVESVDPRHIPAFISPFTFGGEIQTSNYHDHSKPAEFIDNNGILIPWWGESSVVGVDGHEGYDWQLPLGTPIRAVAAGTVTLATMNNGNFFCPLLNQTVANSVVRIEHTLPGGVRVLSSYVHLSRIDVAPGATITAGQQIGLSGQTGCALFPHLHFEVYRLTQLKNSTPSPIDPYGWDGAGPDPWEADANGAASIDLWKPNEAPTLFRFVVLPPNPDPNAAPFVAISQVRFEGVRDATNPNNEYVEVTRDARVAPATLDLGGFTLTNKAGQVYTFPAGTVLSAANPSVRLFTGSGSPTASTLYRGLSSGVYDNLSECVTFANSAGVVRNKAGWGSGC